MGESVIDKDRVRMESQKDDHDHYDDSYQEIYDVCGYIGPTLVCEDKQDNNHVETMSVTRALNVLNISATSTYNLDTKDIAHHVNKMVQEVEQKRVECNRLMRNKRKQSKVSKFLKTPEMLEQEEQQAKWKTSKVREELCLIQEAYQFLISRHKAKEMATRS